jgi:uncharacterized cupin superfamily protein
MSDAAMVVGPAGEAQGALPDTGPRVGAHAGAPMTRTLAWTQPTDEVPGIGVWECTPGAWDVRDARASEVAVITSGRVRLTGTDGQAAELGPGDTVLLPKGWSGRWEVLETVRKVYVSS